MLKVQEYLLEHGIQKLQDEFHIKVKDYEDRVVLNYNQIDSPRFHPIVDECRGLILWKKNWEVAAQSFNRFYNVGEDPRTNEFPVHDPKTRIEEKIDGSIISLYYDRTNSKWQPATRSMAFAEGQTIWGNTFNQVFLKAIEKTCVTEFLEFVTKNGKHFGYTYVFELVSPETRVVTPFNNYDVYLIGARDEFGKEFNGCELYGAAGNMGVKRPESFNFKSIDEMVQMANELPSMQEGFVIVNEPRDTNNFWRIKCKNTKYLAIAHMRSNGIISPKRILELVMKNDHYEYIGYFPEDKKYFDFIDVLYNKSFESVKKIWEEAKNIENQKEFALYIIPLCKYDWQKGVLFNMKKGVSLEDAMRNCEPKKLEKSMGLKEEMKNKFNIDFEESE